MITIVCYAINFENSEFFRKLLGSLFPPEGQNFCADLAAQGTCDARSSHVRGLANRVISKMRIARRCRRDRVSENATDHNERGPRCREYRRETVP